MKHDDLLARLMALDPEDAAPADGAEDDEAEGHRALALRDALRLADAALTAHPPRNTPRLVRDLRNQASQSLHAGYVALLAAGRRAPLVTALACHAMARPHIDLERAPARSLPLLEIARICYERAGGDRRNDLGRLYVAYSNALYPIDATDEARALAERAVELIDPARPFEHARALSNLSDIYDRLQLPDAALAAGERALALLRAADQSDEAIAAMTAIVLRDLGHLYQDWRDAYEDAAELYCQAGGWIAAHGDESDQASLELNRGCLALDLGRFHEADRRLREAEVVFRRLGNGMDEALARFYRAQLALARGDLDEAEHLLAAARAGFAKYKNRRELAEALLLEARILAQRGKAEAALARLDGASERFARLGLEPARATLLLERAGVLLRQYQARGDLAARDAAAAALDQALPLLAGQGRHRRALEARTLRELLRDEPDLAALDACYERLAGYGDFVLRAQVQSALGEHYERHGQPGAAAAAYGRATDDLDAVRAQIRINALVARFFDRLRRPYERAFALAAQGGADAEAWMYAERMQAPALADLLANAGAAAPPEPADGADRAALRRQYERVNALYARSARTAGRQGLRPEPAEGPGIDEIAAGEAELRRLLDEAGLTPDSAPWTIGVPRAAAEVRAALGHDTALVRFLRVSRAGRARRGVPPRDLAAIVLTPATLEVLAGERALAPGGEVDQLLHRIADEPLGTVFAHAAGSPDSDPVQVRKVPEGLQDLYDLFIRPLAGLVAPYPNLVFVLPDDAPALQQLPLHAALDGATYLVERHTVSYAPSASVFWLCQRRAPRPVRAVLAAGYGPDLMPDLAAEVAAVAERFPGARPCVEPFAPDELLAQLEAADLAHLSFHGFAGSGADARLAHLVVGAGERLFAYDLLRRRLRAELVTFSACESGRESQPHLGLVGSAIAAGARSVVATLWQADHRASCRLMAQLYAALTAAPAMGRAAALCLTQRALIASEEFREPAYWAPFFLSGATAPLLHAEVNRR